MAGLQGKCEGERRTEIFFFLLFFFTVNGSACILQDSVEATMDALETIEF